MQARFVFRNEEERERTRQMLGGDPDRIFSVTDLAEGDVLFCATGVTDGPMMRGVKYSRRGATTESIVMRSRSGTIRRIRTSHRFPHQPTNY